MAWKGLNLLVRRDAVREGDGEAMIGSIKYALLCHKGYHPKSTSNCEWDSPENLACVQERVDACGKGCTCSTAEAEWRHLQKDEGRVPAKGCSPRPIKIYICSFDVEVNCI